MEPTIEKYIEAFNNKSQIETFIEIRMFEKEIIEKEIKALQEDLLNALHELEKAKKEKNERFDGNLTEVLINYDEKTIEDLDKLININKILGNQQKVIKLMKIKGKKAKAILDYD